MSPFTRSVASSDPLLVLAMALGGYGGGDDGGNGVGNGGGDDGEPMTSNLVAGPLEVTSAEPRIGYPLDVDVSITAEPRTENVSVVLFAIDKDRPGVRLLALGGGTAQVVGSLDRGDPGVAPLPARPPRQLRPRQPVAGRKSNEDRGRSRKTQQQGRPTITATASRA